MRHAIPGVLACLASAALGQANNGQIYQDAQNAAQAALNGGRSVSQDTSNATAKENSAFSADLYHGAVTPRTMASPDALAAQGAQQDTYQQLLAAQQTQAQFAPADMKALVTTSNTVANNPGQYVAIDASGQQVACQPVPPGSADATHYTATCNTGAAVTTTTPSCLVPNVPQFSNTYSYSCNQIRSTSPGAAGLLAGSCGAYQAAACSMSFVYNGTLTFVAQLQGAATNSYYTATCTAPVQGSVSGPVNFYGVLVGFALTGQTSAYAGSSPDASACTAMTTTGGNPSCSAPIDTCTDASPATRIVNGVSVTQSCWAWTRTYTCNAVTTGNSSCGDLAANANCSLTATQCLDDPAVSGTCQVANQVYTCTVPGKASRAPTFVCSAGIYCVDGSCQHVAAQPSQDFTKAVAALSTVGTVQSELNPANVTLFEGSASGCHKPLFGIENCCSGGPGIPLIGACSTEERQLAIQIDKGITHYVGTFCSSSFLGVCLSEHETFCVFQSKLGRIIEEQGRAQLGLDFGDAKNPICTGLTPQQFAELDLSKMDFSEVMNDLTAAVTLPGQTATLTTMQQKIQAYFAKSGGS